MNYPSLFTGRALLARGTLYASLFCASHLAQAEFDIPKLSSGQGYLLLGVHVHNIIPHKIMLKGDSFLSTESITVLEPGDQYRLLALDPGTYTYEKVFQNAHLNKNFYWNLENLKYSLKVEAGKINYGGHLITELKMSDANIFSFRNRSNRALTFLRICCDSILKSTPLIYSGNYPDPYFDHALRVEGDKK